MNYSFCLNTLLLTTPIGILRKAALLVLAIGALSASSLASAQVTVSPASLSWYKVAVGNAGGPKSVTFTNASGVSVSISSIAFTGANPGDFLISQNTCGSALAVSASCKVTVRFTPTTSGTRTATLTMTDSDPSSPQQVSLTGLGTSSTSSGSVTASPTSLSFGSITQGTASSQSITVSNTTAAAVTLSPATISGANAADFTASSNTCGSSLAASASCTTVIAFDPSTSGSESAVWSITSSNSSTPLTVALSGAGQLTAGSVSVSPTSLSWYKVAIGNAGGGKSVTLTNSGTATLSINSVTFTGANPGDFLIGQNTCGTALAASASCTITVVFRPTNTGTRTATLAIADNDPSSPQQVSLTGIGTGVGASPTSISFGSIVQGTTSSPQSITVTNGTSAAVTLNAATISGTNAADFAVSSTTCGSSLAASASCTAAVVFTPSTTAAESATWTITSSSTNIPLTVSLSGTGAVAAGGASLSPSSLSWYKVNVGNASGAKSATLTNTGSASITISNVAFTGTNAGDFILSQNTCGSTLAASAGCTLSVVFRPTAVGTRTATLNITDTATNSPQQLPLTGIGAGVTVSPASVDFGTIGDGSTAAPQTITVSNSTLSSVTLNPAGISGTNAGDFAIQSTTCGSSLAASATCTANVVFTPTTNAAESAAWSMTTSFSSAPLSVPLSGTGAGVKVSPASLSFGSVTTGTTSAPQSITLSNSTSSAISLGAAAISGTNAADFAVSSTTCGSSLAASSSCTASITFTPATTSGESASWSITVSSAPLSVPLSGTGAGVNVSPASLSFGSVTTGTTSAPQSITVSNPTSSAVSLGAAATSGTNAADFAVSSTTCGSSLAASSSCTASITFTPATTSGESASWSITAGSAPLSVALSGAGTTSTFNINPSTATVSEGATQQFTVNGSATWAASCGSISTSGLFTAPLAPGSCSVTATPADGGIAATAAVTVTSPITLTPASVNLHAINTQQFTASAAVKWTSSCGAISNSGLFTAPASAGVCTITATANGATAYTAVSTANVDVVNYTAWKGGGGGTGAQTDELTLTPSNVNSNTFGLLWSVYVDGWVTAQPLYMNGLVINGTPHNVVFFETQNDSVYAFDGDTGAQLWKVSLIPPGATAVAASSVGYTSVPNQIGILGTPVIDPTTNTMYVVTETSEQNATYFPHRLHAIDVTTGQEKFGGPVLVSDPLMAPTRKFQRTALLLANGLVYIGFGSMGDVDPYHGLLFAFNAQTLAQQAVWAATPTGGEGGIWMGSAAPTVDENGNIYIATGNGTLDGTSNFGQSAVKFTPNLQLLDYFAPYNYADLNTGDLDLGSGNVMIVPDQNGPYPHELIACGKPTPIYVLNRDNMGQVGVTSDNVIQRLDNQLGVLAGPQKVVMACLTSPAMWGQNVYFGGKYDVLKMFTLDPTTGLLSSTPVSQGTFYYSYPGADPVVSANGATNGIVWTVDPVSKTLYASDATNLGNVLLTYTLSGGTFRWTIPTVVNGHVYLGEEGTVYAFGLK